MVIAARSTREHHAVRVEGGRGDGSLARLVQEAGVGLDAREELAIEVEDFDVVGAGAAGLSQFGVTSLKRGEGRRGG